MHEITKFIRKVFAVSLSKRLVMKYLCGLRLFDTPSVESHLTLQWPILSITSWQFSLTFMDYDLHIVLHNCWFETHNKSTVENTVNVKKQTSPASC